MTDFLRLPLRRSRSVFNVVVETPRGSPVKLDYDPKHRVFAYGHPLMLGLQYPYDWGFFPRTRAEDGDPLDALLLHESATYPGVVVGCRLIGVVRLTEKKAQKPRIRNDRVICVRVGRSWFGVGARRGVVEVSSVGGVAGAVVDVGEIEDHAERLAGMLVVVAVVAVAFQHVEHADDQSPREAVIAGHARLFPWR